MTPASSTRPRVGNCATSDNFPVVAGVAAAAVDALADSEAGAVEPIDVALPDHDDGAHLWLRLTSVFFACNADVLKRDGIDLLGAQRADVPDELASLIETGDVLSRWADLDLFHVAARVEAAIGARS